MIKFEAKCINDASCIHGCLVDLILNKVYICEYSTNLPNGIFRIRVYNGLTFIWFSDDEEFSQYFEHKRYLRKKKLEKLAISAKKI